MTVLESPSHSLECCLRAGEEEVGRHPQKHPGHLPRLFYLLELAIQTQEAGVEGRERRQAFL